ncbi:hypothetical protein [Colwellia sp. C1TZA3]|uniref:hypothetical protein n=1 Tax=Colwellia sp. C1TZA3 TaxID=2508879 RepID=UPI0011B9FA8C|nr:hypothetical protein [Colwellia sp. C1TZA3]TWX73047.1 hypothetical protein ESZ39_06190 [Colwellia sp. C1TZA3]
MITNKIFSSMLAITFLLSACGSSSTDKDEAKTVKADEMIAQTEQENNSQQMETKLIETPVNTHKALTGHNMEDRTNKLQDGFNGWQRGRVQFLNLEGGFYGIITDSGKKILPMNMTKEFAQNGAIVRIKGKVKDVMTIQQWGTPFTITDIELIKPGNKVNNADM